MVVAFSQFVPVNTCCGNRWTNSTKLLGAAPKGNTCSPNGGNGNRQIIQANSLEDSKRRAKSQYDNIPDLNQQYLAELSWVERKYGPGRLKKDITKEAQRSILRSDCRAGPQSVEKQSAGGDKMDTKDMRGDREADLTQYTVLRNKLLADTLFVGALGLCGVWSIATIKEVQSFTVGLCGSMAYVALLGRSVDRLGESARTTGTGIGVSLQPARIAILALLIVGAAKNSQYLSVIPVLIGFFTYKVALLIPLITGEAFE
ncbi:ATP synthase protein I [Gracilariopsis chorda]|uniref:ATP synthase protein I n=1 Tax=Gracilariopsis chorda TaxID=448386 RepID=A0A2V3IKM7_9FLOR|nr:ATP synthase protein I [Gracilariopsis chorda]|eukprot:PXF42621.1 ATP synthase protein I [Gracilariopsis chorda]